MLNQLHNDDMGKLLLRLTVGGLMMFHGVAKIAHPGSIDAIGGGLGGIGLPSIIAYGVYIGEVIAPLMIVAGYYARIGGLVVVVNMVFAIAIAHSSDIYSLTEHGGWAIELQVFYLCGGLAIAMLGSGKFAFQSD